jgi:20S proteasome alpha/beta subunit
MTVIDNPLLNQEEEEEVAASSSQRDRSVTVTPKQQSSSNEISYDVVVVVEATTEDTPNEQQPPQQQQLLHGIKGAANDSSSYSSLVPLLPGLRRQRLQLLWLLLVLGLLLSTTGFVTATTQFDPYQLNGGLVAAVAGRDYVVLAADTRLTGSSGYDVLQSQQHMSSRLWSMTNRNGMVPPPSSSSSSSSGNMADTLQAALLQRRRTQATVVATNHMARSSQYNQDEEDKDKTVIELPCIPLSSSSSSVPVWVGSVGCQADCEMLKRTCQSAIQRGLQTTCEFMVPVVVPTSLSWHDDGLSKTGTTTTTTVHGTTNLPASLAIWLGQTLYSRRTFPYYAFCVMAGCTAAQGGQVYGYDAIGSYERLAVAVAGQGRSILQSILDRSFHGSTETSPKATTLLSSKPEGEDSTASGTTTTSIPNKVVHMTPTQVTETAQETIQILIQSFQQVAQREASVGDELVVLCWQYDAAKGSIQPTITIVHLPD